MVRARNKPPRRAVPELAPEPAGSPWRPHVFGLARLAPADLADPADRAPGVDGCQRWGLRSCLVRTGVRIPGRSGCSTRGLFGHMPHRTKHLGFAAGVGVLWNSTKRARRPLRLPRPQPQRPGSVLEQCTWVEHTGRAHGSSTRVEKTSTRIEKGSSR
jgi:hypothetical protein